MQKKKRALSKKYIVVLMAIGLISVCAIGWGMTRGQTTQTMTQQPAGEETSSTQGEETPWNLRLINNDRSAADAGRRQERRTFSGDLFFLSGYGYPGAAV